MPPPSFSYPRESLLAFEIVQQPELWPTTLQRVSAAGFSAETHGSPVVVCGAGTSAYAASAIVEAWPEARAIPTTDLLLQSGSEILSVLPGLPEGGLVISLARSGDSPESVAVVEKMQRLFPRVRHLAIVCNPDGRLANMAGVQVLLLDPRANDRSLAMTGSFSNLTLAGLALKHCEQLAQELPDICMRLERFLEDSRDQFAAIAQHCDDRIVLLASCMQALTKEAALKIIELTDGRIMAMPETFLGFRHGAVGFLREDTPVVCFLSSDPDKRRYEYDLMEDLRGKGLGRFVIVGEDPSIANDRDWFLPASAPSLPDALRTPFEVPLAQLLAYQLSVRVQVDPDNPSPKGTITRVVRPFRIHQQSEEAQ